MNNLLEESEVQGLSVQHAATERGGRGGLDRSISLYVRVASTPLYAFLLLSSEAGFSKKRVTGSWCLYESCNAWSGGRSS